MLRPKRTWGSSFTMLVGTFRQPTDPSQNNPGEVFMQGYTTQRFVDGHTPGHTPLGGGGLTAGIVPDIKPTLDGDITVADNDFTTGVASVTVAEHTVVAGLDFLIGAGDADTATNLAAALDRFPDVEASALAAVVSVSVAYRLGPAEFSAKHLGTIVNFTLDSAHGELVAATPQLLPPQF